MYLKARIAVLAFAVASLAPISTAARQAPAHAAAASNPDIIECRVLEAHSSTAPPVFVVIFHQWQKKDQPRLAALLKQNSGSKTDVQIGSAPWTKVTVFRLRTCFGRGMLIFPSATPALKEGATFRIRLSKGHGGK